MKKTTSILLFTLVVTSLFLSSCGAKLSEVTTINEPVPEEVIAPIEETLPSVADEEKKPKE
jgi:outer membrane lipoprotein-sorting protein